MRDDFCVVVFSYNRHDNIPTLRVLERCGYTGPVFIVVDDRDPELDAYRARFGEQLLVFSKEEAATTFDEGDNFGPQGVAVYARNAAFDLVAERGFRWFVQLDDDYTFFNHRYDQKGDKHTGVAWLTVSRFWSECIEIMEAAPYISSICMAQAGDFIGGEPGKIRMTRKAMNSFLCTTDRRIRFLGKMNEDVSVYTSDQRRGCVYLTATSVYLSQEITQQVKGGMSEAYIQSGTYVKSFYSVMHCPSGVIVYPIQGRARTARLHHRVAYNTVAPKILAETHRRT